MVSSRTVLGIVAVILDAFSRKVVGWAMAECLRAELKLEAFWTDILLGKRIFSCCRSTCSGRERQSPVQRQVISLFSNSMGAAE